MVKLNHSLHDAIKQVHSFSEEDARNLVQDFANMGFSVEESAIREDTVGATSQNDFSLSKDGTFLFKTASFEDVHCHVLTRIEDAA